MDQFPERHNLSNLTQEELHIWIGLYLLDIESIINNLPKQEAPGPDVVTGEFCPIFKEEMMPNLCSLLEKIEAEGILSNSVFEASIILIAKPKAL